MDHFDFTKKRVYHNGKPMTKFEMGYYLQNFCVHSYHWYGFAVTLHEEIYSYSEVADMLHSALIA